MSRQTGHSRKQAQLPLEQLETRGPLPEEQALRRRKRRLQQQIDDVNRRVLCGETCDELRREIAELETQLEQLRRDEREARDADISNNTEKTMTHTDKNAAALEIVEKARRGAVDQHSDFRKANEDLFELRVDQIQKEHACTRSRAYALAADDPVASQAYARSVEAHDSQTETLKGADMLGLHVGR